jgi:hypothetical protein
MLGMLVKTVYHIALATALLASPVARAAQYECTRPGERQTIIDVDPVTHVFSMQSADGKTAFLPFCEVATKAFAVSAAAAERAGVHCVQAFEGEVAIADFKAKIGGQEMSVMTAFDRATTTMVATARLGDKARLERQVCTKF